MADEHKKLGNEAFKAQNFEEAIKHYTEGIEVDPKNHVLYSNRSACFASLQKYDEALVDADKTIELQPQWPKGYSRKGAALIGKGDPVAAKLAYEEGLKHEPNNQQLKDGVEQADEKIRARASAPVDSMRQMGALFSGPDVLEKLASNPQTAPFLVDPQFRASLEAVRKNPDSIQQHFDQRMLQCMMVLMGQDVNFGARPEDGEETEAMETEADDQPEEKKEEEQPKEKEEPKVEEMETEEEEQVDPEVKARQEQALKEKEAGTAAYKKKDLETALAHYQKAAELDPEDMVYQLNISAALFEMKKYEECVEVCIKAAEIGIEHRADYKKVAKAYFRAGKACFSMDKLEDSVKWCDKALTNHRTPDTLAFKKKVEKEMKERAAKAYIDPEKSLEAKNRGNELFKAGKYPDAIKEYSEAIKRNPEDGKLYSNRAACYVKLTELPLALKDCDECIKLAPDFIKGYLRKGGILIGMKKYKEAIEAYEAALKIDANHPEAKDGIQRANAAQYGTNLTPEERQQQALQDPEIQEILRDPVMQSILEQMSKDPQAVQEHLKNPDIATKITKLANAGILQFR